MSHCRVLSDERKKFIVGRAHPFCFAPWNYITTRKRFHGSLLILLATGTVDATFQQFVCIPSLDG